MIYLFGEAKERQKGYLWDSEKFAEYASYIKPIYNFDEYRSIKRDVFAPGNTILYHESFSLNQPNQHEKDFLTIKNDLSEYSKENGLLLAMFSGSEQDRRLNGNVAYLPVSYLYGNLECFIKHSKTSEPDLRHLLYGDNYEIEEKICELLNEEISKSFENQDSHSNVADCSVVVIHTDNEYDLTTSDIDESDEKTIFSNDISGENLDEKLDKYVKEWLGNKEYDAIVIPLCFGNSLSDFNGLRMAVHIRCTNTVNRLKPIFIFGIQRHDLILSSPYYDILKTKGVVLVGYDFQSVKETINKYIGTLNISELSVEIGKMNIPYHEDGHSVANKWAIYRWSMMLPMENVVDRSGIDEVVSDVSHNVYFKYLATKYPVRDSDRDGICLKVDSITPEMSSSRLDLLVEDPRILYVDDEAEKGWFELFDIILGENNSHLYVDYIQRDDFTGKEPDEIIKMILEKISVENYNIVVLDFRLHPSDFNANKIDDITGYKSLCEIKKHNPGIQVMVFSATNKVWNLQRMQEVGADGFIIKESPLNSVDRNFTRETIQSFIKELNNVVLDRFKAKFYEECICICKNIKQYEPETDEFENVLNLLKKQFELIVKAIPRISSQDKGSIDIAFISCYNVFECLKDSYLRQNKFTQYYIGEEKGVVYKMEESNFKKHIHKMQDPVEITAVSRENGDPVRPSLFDFMGSLLFYFGLAERRKTDPLLKDLWDIIDWRNTFIHGNKAHFTSEELMVMIQLCREISGDMKA